MSNSKITRVVIVGGGTAGWMTAAALSNVFERAQVPIQLIESAQIGTIGVGEATIPQIAIYNNLLGIDENDFLKFASGTFKLGIEFSNWGKIGEKYIHPFDNYGTQLDALQFYHHWQKHFLHNRSHENELGKPSDIEEYSLCVQAAKANKFMRPTGPANSPLANMGYAFHFDANKYSQFLRDYAVQRGVVHTEGSVDEVTLSADGHIQSLLLGNGKRIEGDLFIDCTGFKGLLIEEALKTGYDDWSDLLPCDRAVTVATENTEDPIPYTKAIAHTAGWQWRIPLQHRVGNGHVYASKFMSADEATAILLSNVKGKTLSEPRHIHFTTGKRKKFWNKNCIAIGLSSGFMEPLESTSIHLIQSSISKLIALFPSKKIETVEVEQYNQMLTEEFLYIRDFLVLHYYATERDDSPFWNYCRTMDVPQRLKNKITLYQSSGRIFRENFELFDETSWLAVMHGQGLQAKNNHPAADVRPISVVDKQLQQIRQVINRSVDSMPTHAQYIAKHCQS